MVLAAAMLAACSPATPPQTAEPRETPAEAPPAPPAPRTVATPSEAPPPRPAAAPALTLELTYQARVLVPAGSDIEVTGTDAAGKPLVSQKLKTESDAPPYTVKLTLPPDYSGIIKINSRLDSKIGHSFSQTTEIDTAKANTSGPIRIVMQME